MAKDTIKELEGQTVRDRDGTTIGKVKEVYLDEDTDRPTWAVVRAGRLGKSRFVPLWDAETGGDDIRLAVTSVRVEEAPEVKERQRLSPELEADLRRHYDGSARTEGSARTAPVPLPSRDRGRSDDGGERQPSPRERQRDEFGGFNIGAALLGWLVAAGIAIILTAIVSAAGGAIGLTEVSASEARQNAATVSIVGGVLLAVVLMLAYFTGGYNAGRLSRFDGGRHGFGVWVVGLLITVLLAVAGLVFGSEYNVLQRLDLPRIPIDEGSLATGGLITLVVVVLGTLLAAILGGKAGERYHRKVDRAGANR